MKFNESQLHQAFIFQNVSIMNLDLVEQLGSGIPRILESYPKECFKFSDHFLRMSFPINDQASDQVDDQAKAKDLTEHLKVSLNSLGKVKRKLMVEFKMPTEKQVEKYAKLAAQLKAEQIEILKFSEKPKSNKEIQEECLGLKTHSDNFKRYIEPLINLKALNRTLTNVPNSPLQKYFTTAIGHIMLLVIDYK